MTSAEVEIKSKIRSVVITEQSLMLGGPLVHWGRLLRARRAQHEGLVLIQHKPASP
jgi:hypothetical protein